ncbi:MLP-like protein 31 [Silene latifolia]|uniref:MLP-like protein 31 n=1 Tax=Silene latifolia TaxID=37657 RepID=UPI003D785C4D
MGVFGKLQVEVDITPSGDVFHELFANQPHHLSTIVPDQVHGYDVHEGELGKPGSIIQWDYTLDGKKSVAKQELEVVDEEKKMIKFKFLEGSDLLKEYKNMSVTFQAIPKGDFEAILWDIDFERFDDFGPYPTSVMDFFIKVTRDVEAHHHANA